MPAWLLTVGAVFASLLQSVLQGIFAYEAGKNNGQLQAQLAAAADVVATQQKQLADVRTALAVRARLAGLSPVDTERLRQWYAAQHG